MDNKKKKSSGDWGIRIVIIVTIIIGILIIAGKIKGETDDFPRKSYPEFKKDWDAGLVDLIEYAENSEDMTVYLFNDETKNMSYDEREKYTYSKSEKEGWYVTEYPAYFDFRKDYLESGIRLSTSSGTASNIANIVSLVGSSFMLIILISFFITSLKTLGGAMKSEIVEVVENPGVKFEDVIGHDEVMDDIKFLTSFLKDKDKGKAVGAEPPRGIVFYGDPGCGKTHIAKAMASEAGVPFLSVNSSRVVEMYAGLGAKRIRSIFAKARKMAPCILFFDELDAIGEERHSGGSVDQEYNQIINALLQELDGMANRTGIFVIAATNRADVLDTALVRSGRFDRKILIGKPKDWQTRYKLAQLYAGKYVCDENLDLTSFCKQCTGFTGADIASVINQASLIATKNDTLLTNDAINEAFENKIFNGSRTKKSEEELRTDKELVAYHEAGHAVASLLLDMPIERISVIGNTSGVGGAVFNSDDNSQFQTKEKIEKRIQIYYAGRASEDIHFDTISTGACNDIEVATSLIADYTEKFGFDDEFGLISTRVLADRSSFEVNRSDRLKKTAKAMYDAVHTLLNDNYAIVTAFAEKLLECETMDSAEIIELYDKVKSA